MIFLFLVFFPTKLQTTSLNRIKTVSSQVADLFSINGKVDKELMAISILSSC